jgi:hypothetical protein
MERRGRGRRWVVSAEGKFLTRRGGRAKRLGLARRFRTKRAADRASRTLVQVEAI